MPVNAAEFISNITRKKYFNIHAEIYFAAKAGIFHRPSIRDQQFSLFMREKHEA
jgi:hypothetical protein